MKKPEEMTDEEWWASLPPGVEFLTPPPGWGVFPGGYRCRPNEDDFRQWYPGVPIPPGTVALEFWAAGPACVSLAELRQWPRFDSNFIEPAELDHYTHPDDV